MRVIKNNELPGGGGHSSRYRNAISLAFSLVPERPKA